MAAASAPAITGFSPSIGAAGATITVTGSGFETTTTNNRAMVSGAQAQVSAATATSLTMTVPSAMASGRITVKTPGGTATSSGDLFVVPPPYAATDVEATGRIAVGGAGQTVTLTAANKIGMVVFDGTAGQRLNLGLSGDTIGTSPYYNTVAKLYRPNGTLWASAEVGTSGGDLDSAPLPDTGAYTVIIDPSGTLTGSVTVTASVPVTGTLAYDTPAVPLTLGRPGQDARLTFSGAAGQYISLGMSGDTIGTNPNYNTIVTIFPPDGTQLATKEAGTSGGDLDTGPLPATGTYEVVVDPAYALTGNVTLTLSQDITGVLTSTGGSAAIAVTRRGQNARYTFDGTAGERLSLGVSGVSLEGGSGYVDVYITKPDGTNLVSPLGVDAAGGDFDFPVLPVTGTYTVFANPRGGKTANFTLTLSAALTGTLTLGGASAPVSVGRPGQDARYSFDGTAGQLLNVGMSGLTLSSGTCCADWSLLKPDGTTLSSDFISTAGGDFDTAALPATGSYTAVVDLRSAKTGSFTLTLSSPVTGTITIGGPGVPVTMGRPGQDGRLTFDGTASQQVNLTLTAVTLSAGTCCMDYRVLKPDGTQLTSGNTFPTSANKTFTLPVAGTYTLVIDPRDGKTGSTTATLTQVTGAAPGLFIEARQVEQATATPCPRRGCETPTPAATATPCPRGRCDTTTPTLTATATPTAAATATPCPRGACAPATPTPTPAPEAGESPSATPTPAGPPREDDADPERAARAKPGRSGPAGRETALPDEENDEDGWTPDAGDRQGDWRIGRPETVVQRLAPPEALPGVTALAGQVLALNGRPLRGVRLRIDDVTAETDAWGHFLLADLPAGHEELVVDGRGPGWRGRSYGTYEVGVDLTGGRTTVLPYTIWLARIDEAQAVTIPSPTTSEVVVTTPDIPGLELHIPAGATIRDLDGQAVTRVSLTALPVDRPPFPLPAHVIVPVYFTVQPGGAYVSPGARLIYPNYTHEAPGTRLDFWHYDPGGRGWYVYGQGSVTADGRQVVPDPGVAIYAFTGAMINVPSAPPPPPKGPRCFVLHVICFGGDPVDLGTGLFVYEKADLALPDVLPLSLTRTYRQDDTAARPFGIGTTHPYAMYLWSAQQYQQADLVLPDGARVHYGRTSPGTSWTDAVFAHTATPTLFYQSRIVWNGNGWDLTLRDGTVYVFGENAPLQAIRDRNGNTITLTWSSTNSYGSGLGNLVQVTSPNGRWLAFSYDTSNRITQATDNAGRTVGYTYDASGRLGQVTDAAGGVTAYTYDAAHRMLTITDARGITYLTNEYDGSGRVFRQTQADTGTYQFAYTVDGSGTIIQTDVTDPRGLVRRVTFNTSGFPLTDTKAVGTPDAQTVTYERQTGTNLLLSETDALGRRTAYTYDPGGNRTSVTRLAGTATPVTTSYTYEPSFNQVASITDPLGHVQEFRFDAKGNVIGGTDPRTQTVLTTLTYDAAGQPLSITDPAGTTQFAYDLGDLVRVTDPLGRASTRFVDGAGRLVSVTDPLGNTTRTSFDALDLPTATRDALTGMTAFSYDSNGNVVSITDPRQTAQGTAGMGFLAYDTMDRLSSRTDALGVAESYEYDLAGNLSRFTDRRGQVTVFSYDNLNRRAFAGFGQTIQGGTTSYASTVTFMYDAADRPTQLVDSVAGTITRTYDGLDRLMQETSPQGAVSYGYDAAGRRTSMTVAGQAAVSYTYDNGDRLTQITQGAATVTLAYDDANRLTVRMLPGGVSEEYTYDAASRVTGITYKRGATVLGDLTYEYDWAGRRIRMGGSYARTGLPAAVSTAVYNNANQLTTWGTVTFTYDANGNMTGDGTHTYTWDARNHLAAIATGGATTATFQYDAVGRRTARTVGGVTTGFVYDGINPAQELVGGSPSANLLTGLGVDDYLTRTDGAGGRTFLKDALGSTLALVDGAGAVQTQYTYDPFGTTTASGQSNSNPFRYTGREDDGTGLYFYRARYYQPDLQRFISADPLLCGITLTFPIRSMSRDPQPLNGFAYVSSSPTNQRDPMGLEKDCDYYREMCEANNGNSAAASAYYCWLARKICSSGRIPDTGGTRCYRLCLQDGDRTVCRHIPIKGRKTFINVLVCTFTGVHISCFFVCAPRPINPQPLPPMWL